jgi:tetratricopeptide (TPR) repeat protein
VRHNRLALRIAAGALALTLYACVGQGPRTPAAPTPQAPAASAHALFEHGRALAAQGDLNRAQQYLKLALAAGYSEARVVVALVQVCLAASRLREALEYAATFLRRHPDDWRLRVVTAAIDSALGRHAQAADELRRVIAQRPDAAQPHYLLAVVARDGYRDDDAARAGFSAYLDRAPHGPFAAEAAAWLAEHARGKTP